MCHLLSYVAFFQKQTNKKTPGWTQWPAVHVWDPLDKKWLFTFNGHEVPLKFCEPVRSWFLCRSEANLPSPFKKCWGAVWQKTVGIWDVFKLLSDRKVCLDMSEPHVFRKEHECGVELIFVPLRKWPFFLLPSSIEWYFFSPVHVPDTPWYDFKSTVHFMFDSMSNSSSLPKTLPMLTWNDLHPETPAG